MDLTKTLGSDLKKCAKTMHKFGFAEKGQINNAGVLHTPISRRKHGDVLSMEFNGQLWDQSTLFPYCAYYN